MFEYVIIIGLVAVGIYLYYNKSSDGYNNLKRLVKQESFSPYKMEPYNNLSRLIKQESFSPYKMEPFITRTKGSSLIPNEKLNELKSRRQKYNDMLKDLDEEHESFVNNVYERERSSMDDMKKKKLRDEMNREHSDYENTKRKLTNEISQATQDIKTYLIKENLEDEEITVKDEDKIQYYFGKGQSATSQPSKKYLGLSSDMAYLDIRGIPQKLMDNAVNDPSYGINPFSSFQVGTATRLDLAQNSGLTSGTMWDHQKSGGK